MILYPNSKINIGLNVLNQRDDGFHNIETVMYPLKWCDALEILIDKETTVETQGIKLDLLSDRNNLVYKSWELLFNEFSIPNVRFILQKNIPHGSGLGGGSSDAAFALVGLNKMFNLGLSDEILEQYSSRLGSDCAFFIRNKPSFSYGRGELLKPVNVNLSGLKIIVVKPPVSISTAKAYDSVTMSEDSCLLDNINNLNFENWNCNISNAFEDYAIKVSSEIYAIKQLMLVNNARYVALSGSGSAVYGIFDNNISLRSDFKNKSGYYYWEEVV